MCVAVLIEFANDQMENLVLFLFRLPFLFNLSNLCKSPNVAFLACEARGYKRTHNLEREFFAGNARAPTEDVAVVMFA
jgi:hypothetical protein